MATENEEHTRACGVTFGALKRALREHRYPVTVAELAEQYGGFELETPTGTESVESALRACEASRFTEPWEVRDAIVEGVSDEARSGAADGTEGTCEEDEGTAVGDWSQLSV
ncbi:DUF5789 family protein [Halorubrum sp. DTA46]|uniref:DUF5789 family protein n=1 Tax=Halorubrum sp. DTA46 TaxID=3402162 RepID=UPI003AABE674